MLVPPLLALIAGGVIGWFREPFWWVAVEVAVLSLFILWINRKEIGGFARGPLDKPISLAVVWLLVAALGMALSSATYFLVRWLHH